MTRILLDRKTKAKKVRLVAKVCRYEQVNRNILDKYGSLEQLKRKKLCYLQQASLELKQSYNDYKHYMRNARFVKTKIIEVLEIEAMVEGEWNEEIREVNFDENEPVVEERNIEDVNNEQGMDENNEENINEEAENEPVFEERNVEDVNNEQGMDENNEENINEEADFHIATGLSFEESFHICCANCRRGQSQQLINDYHDDCYVIEFERYDITAVKRRRKFNLIPIRTFRSEARVIILCIQCGTHLTLETSRANKKIYDSCQNSWPGFLWYLLSNCEFQRIYGSRLWQFLPITWRFWWLEEASRYFQDNISLHNPESLFIDKTREINEWDQEIDSKNIGRLRDVSNKLLMPCVLCPWGCTEFLHK